MSKEVESWLCWGFGRFVLSEDPNWLCLKVICMGEDRKVLCVKALEGRRVVGVSEV